MTRFGGALALSAFLACIPACISGYAQTATPGPAANASQSPGAAPSPANPTAPEAAAPSGEKKHMTPAEAKELMRSVDEILKFASDDTGLPIRKSVKRRLITRDEVNKYVIEKFNEDEDAKRMQRSEIVLKKFGMLDRDFQLRPFLTSLLTEQIAGYYDDKTKTVNLLDWIDADSQKPVLAHELTHALQDQRVDLEKWGNKSDASIARNAAEDNQHLATDETDTARDAVLEGQAMAVFVDYALKPTGKTLLTAPDLAENLKDNMEDSSDSPVMARAPLLLQQSLLFPYREGLSFEQALLKDSGKSGAFGAPLDRPPSTSYEILNPAAYERGQKVPLLSLPDVHDLLRADYDPYDVGVIGELDVRMLVELFAGTQASEAVTPQWDGGIYYAAQKKEARTPEQKNSTASLSLFYLSRWKTEAAANKFAAIYADEMAKKYSGVSRDQKAETSQDEQVYKTNEGPVLIAISGRQVFTSESFDMATARKLELLVLNAQPGENMQSAAVYARFGMGTQSQGLTAGMAHWLAGCGLMKAALPR